MYGKQKRKVEETKKGGNLKVCVLDTCGRSVGPTRNKKGPTPGQNVMVAPPRLMYFVLKLPKTIKNKKNHYYL